jgi:hypothetical protein
MLQDWVKKEFSPVDELEEQRKSALLEEMGLTDRDTKRLREQMVSADEAVAAKKEELTTIRQSRGRKDNWLEYLDIKARVGRVLHCSEILRRLRTIIPGLYPYDGRVRGTVGLVAPIVRTFEDGFHAGWEYLGWIHADKNTEYEIDLVDGDGVPRGRCQGWRTLLLNLIIRRDGTGQFVLKERGIVQDGTGLPLKIITEEQAMKAFGWPTNGATASNYRRQLYEFRNGKRLNPVAWT